MYLYNLQHTVKLVQPKKKPGPYISVKWSLVVNIDKLEIIKKNVEEDTFELSLKAQAVGSLHIHRYIQLSVIR